MATPSEQSNRQSPPALAELFNRYLQEQTMAHQAGLGFADSGDVTPYDAVAAQPIDPRLAWDGACAAIRYLAPTQDLRSWKVPVDWPALIAAQGTVMLLPFCIGNFPQLVRDLPGMFDAESLTPPRAGAQSAVPPSTLIAWAENASKTGPHPLLAAAALRLAGQFDRATKVLEQAEKTHPEWQTALANEKAAVAWHRGEIDQATALWESLPPTAPVLFNRGLAALAGGRKGDARTHFNAAVAQIPESDGWHHLGRLYLALADLRG
jgi:tetratricopeptide (TPR) repeat protein